MTILPFRETTVRSETLFRLQHSLRRVLPLRPRLRSVEGGGAFGRQRRELGARRRASLVRLARGATSFVILFVVIILLLLVIINIFLVVSLRALPRAHPTASAAVAANRHHLPADPKEEAGLALDVIPRRQPVHLQMRRDEKKEFVYVPFILLYNMV